MPTQLTQLELMEISLVPAGDDPLAKVAIAKRHDPKEKEEHLMEETTEQMTKELEDKITELEGSVEKMKEDNEALRAIVLKEGYKITSEGIEKKAPEEMIEVEGEMVAKSAIPAPVLKALEAAEFAKRDAELVKKAKETLPNFDEAVAKSFMGMELSEDQINALKAADALFGKMTEEQGETQTESSMKSAKDKLEEMIAKVADELGLNKYAAYAEVAKTKEGKALITEAEYKKEA